MNVQEKLLKSFEKVKNLYDEEEFLADIIPCILLVEDQHE